MKLGKYVISSPKFRVATLALTGVLALSGCATPDGAAPAEGNQATAVATPAATPTPIPSEPSPEDNAAVDSIHIEGTFGAEPVLDAPCR